MRGGVKGKCKFVENNARVAEFQGLVLEETVMNKIGELGTVI